MHPGHLQFSTACCCHGRVLRMHTLMKSPLRIPQSYECVQWSWFALGNLSRKTESREVAASLPGRFLSRRCFTLCITMEVEPRIAKLYKCHHCCSCKNYRGKGMEGGQKVSLRRFLGWPEDSREFVEKKCVLGHPVARATSYCLLPDTACCPTRSNYGPPKMPLKLAV